MAGNESTWVQIHKELNDLLINQSLLQKGIVAVKTSHPPHLKAPVTEDGFALNNQEFVFNESIDTLQEIQLASVLLALDKVEIKIAVLSKELMALDPSRHVEIKKLNNQLENQQLCLTNYRKRIEKFRTSASLMMTLMNFVNNQKPENYTASQPIKMQIIHNKNRHREVFYPLVLENFLSRQGQYVYPWLTNANLTQLDQFNGFKVFYSACCLFGTILQCFDDNNFTSPLIDHNMKMCDEQKITGLILDHQNHNFYTALLQVEWEKLANIITCFSEPNQPKKVIFHLPYYDYIFFGLKLYLNKKINYHAMNSFLELIYKEKEKYIHSMQAIFRKSNIEISIQNPFQNLFGDWQIEDYSLAGLMAACNYDLRGEQDERELVQNCLYQLSHNNHNETHRTTWRLFLENTDPNKINTIEDLFRIANAVMLGISTSGYNNYEVCSYLPLSEEPIQLNYQLYVEQIRKKNQSLSDVFNLTMLDSLLTFSVYEKHNGLPFYFRFCYESMTKLISQHEILQQTARQFGKNKIALKFFTNTCNNPNCNTPQSNSSLRRSL